MTSSQPIKWWFPANNRLVFATDIGYQDGPGPTRRTVRVRTNRPPPPLPANFLLQISEHRPVRSFTPGTNYRTRGHKKPRETFYGQLFFAMQQDGFGARASIPLPGADRNFDYMRIVFVPNAFFPLERYVIVPAFAYADLDEHDVTQPPWPPLI